MPEPKPEPQKLPRGVAKKAKKVMTGPLLGPIEPAAAGQAGEEVPATRAPIGTIQDVRARINAITEG